MKKDIDEEELGDVHEEFGSYTAQFVDRYGDTGNEIYAYVKEVECVKKI